MLVWINMQKNKQNKKKNKFVSKKSNKLTGIIKVTAKPWLWKKVLLLVMMLLFLKKI